MWCSCVSVWLQTEAPAQACWCLHVSGLVLRQECEACLNAGLRCVSAPQAASEGCSPPPHLPPPSVLAAAIFIPPSLHVWIRYFNAPSACRPACAVIPRTHTDTRAAAPCHLWEIRLPAVRVKGRAIAEQRGSARCYRLLISRSYLPRLYCLIVLPFVLQSQQHFTHLTRGAGSRVTHFMDYNFAE